MIARKKVAPPITPRIVQSHPRQRLFQSLLLVGLVLLAAWIGYEIGHEQVPPGDLVAQLQAPGTAPDTSGLEQQRDALKQQVVQLQQQVKQLEQERETLQSQPAEPLQAAPATTELSLPEPAVVLVEADDRELKLENVDIARMLDNDTFLLSFSVMHTGSSSDRVIGTIWIAVNGHVNGTPTRLALKSLSPAKISFVKMSFELQQDVTEELVLPDDFHPRNILIEAKPFGDRYTGTAGTFDWNP